MQTVLQDQPDLPVTEPQVLQAQWGLQAQTEQMALMAQPARLGLQDQPVQELRVYRGQQDQQEAPAHLVQQD